MPRGVYTRKTQARRRVKINPDEFQVTIEPEVNITHAIRKELDKMETGWDPTNRADLIRLLDELDALRERVATKLLELIKTPGC